MLLKNMIQEKLDNLEKLDITAKQKAETQTRFLQKLSLLTHAFYEGKMMVMPKVSLRHPLLFSIWYTPGVASVSRAIRGNNELSFSLSNRHNSVAVVSDSTRVLGDGDCTPPGGLGVMEGKALLMKFLGGVDATALCVNSKDEQGQPIASKLIDFVKMCAPSFGAINLEDISSPNCYQVLDTLRAESEIPVWHDDAQGTACVTLAGLLNALKLTEKKIEDVKMVFFGVGAANTSVINLIWQIGGNPKNMIVLNSKGGLHVDRQEFAQDTRLYKQWEICQKTNPQKINKIEEALKGADVLIALSKPGPDTIKPEWISLMGQKAIVFACANPVPEIYPYAAKAAGAYIVATGRSDFPNQVNNSLGFPGILKGTLLVRARKITDAMAIAASRAIAGYIKDEDLSADNIMPTMADWELVPTVAAAVAEQAQKDGVARKNLTSKEVFARAKHDIELVRQIQDLMENKGFIKPIPDEIIEKAWLEAIP